MVTKEKVLNWSFITINLLIVILLFTIIDHTAHGLQDTWGVPDYYFRNKIPFGFLWGLVGLLVVRKIQGVWLKALTTAGIISVTLQTRYLLEGYPLNFVFIFLLIHFIILCPLLAIMFFIFRKYNQ